MLLLGSGTQPAVTFFRRVVVFGEKVVQKHALRKCRAFGYKQRFVAFVGHAHENVPLVFRLSVVGVDNSHSVVEFQTVLKTQSAAWENHQTPVRRHYRPDTGGYGNRLTRLQIYVLRGKKVVACALRSRSFGHTYAFVCFFVAVGQKLLQRNFEKLCFHFFHILFYMITHITYLFNSLTVVCLPWREICLFRQNVACVQEKTAVQLFVTSKHRNRFTFLFFYVAYKVTCNLLHTAQLQGAKCTTVQADNGTSSFLTWR